MSAIILNGSIVHYEALGRGRPVLFLHSWIGSWRYWIPAMQVASTSYRAYALDLFGFGETSRDALRYPLDRQAELVDGFLEKMGIGRVAIIGHGLGGLVGFAFLKKYPRTVDRILAVNCPLEYSEVNGRVQNANALELAGWLSSRSPGAADFLIDAHKVDLQAVAASLTGLKANNLFHEVCDMGVPCLLLYGRNDPAITAPDRRDDIMLPLHMHQIILDGAGHFPMMDEPARFNRLMIDFLALESGLSPRELSLKDEWRRRVR